MKQKPSFFRVLRGDFSKQLRIPPAFLKSSKGISLGKCILRSPTGEFWPVNVEKNANDLCFGSGWEEFAKYHSLDINEFLVFKYYGKSMFTVKIYDKSTCEKDIDPVRMNKDPTTFCLENGNQNQEKVGTRKYKSEICEIGSEEKAINVVQSRCLRSGQKPVIAVDKPTTSAVSFKSENSCFKIIWGDAHRYTMTIPRQLAREKNFMTKKMVMLIDPTGKSWPVNLSVQSDGRLNLKEGWPDFWKGNSINRGDTLVFEITQEIAMQVHTYRAKESIVPFKPKILNPANA